MNQLANNDRELLFSRKEAYHAWIAQIEKDLHFTFEPEEEVNWNQIIEQLVSRLDELEKESRLSEILYQVDLNEAQLHTEMSSGKWTSWLGMLAHKVAEREAVKVIFRLQYAGKW